MFCINCGNDIDDHDLFCNMCGTKVTRANSQPTQRVFLHKCESCGAKVKKLSSTRYICEYCGSEYGIDKDHFIQDSKTTEQEVLDVFYKAAEFESKDMFREELQCLLGIADIASENVLYMVKLGRAYRRNNMPKNALDCYEKAKRLNSEYAAIYTNIGAVYILSKQYKEAEEPCLKAVELMNRNRADYPNDQYAVAYANLALAVGMQGQKSSAKQYLKIAEDNGYKNGDRLREMVGIRKGLFSFF